MNPIIPLKRCSKCGIEKPHTREFFYTMPRGEHGLHSQCKECGKQYTRDRWLDPEFRDEYACKHYKGEKPIPATRVCTKCGIEKPFTAEFFVKDSRVKSGLTSHCKVCAKVYQDKLYSDPANLEKARLKAQKWLSNPENKERKNTERNQRYAEDPEYHDKQVTSTRARVATPDGKAQKKTSKAARRAREHQLPDTLTKGEWQHCLEYWDHKCCVCGRSADFWHVIALEHWIPIMDKRADNPGTVARNVLPMCHSINGVLAGDSGCNNTKHETAPLIWLTRKYGAAISAEILARIQAYFDSLP